jgi:hypothetical protein
MNCKSKRDIRNKSRLACGLVNILKYDVDNLMSDANECNLDRLMDTMQEAKETLQNVIDVMAEIEYVLYLNKFRES